MKEFCERVKDSCLELCGGNVMNTYTKPIVIVSEEASEGVYAASGCYNVNANIHQSPQNGRGDYRIQVNAGHDADHTSSEQILTLTFNQEVTYQHSSGQLVSATTGNSISIKYYYWNNPHDNVGIGEVVVSSEAGLALLSARMTDNA